MANDLVRLAWIALVQGSLVAIAALGLTLIFGILNYINAAYAEYLTVGAYVTLSVFRMFGSNLAIVPAVAAGAAAAAAVALVSEEVVFRQFRSRPPVILLIVSLSLGSIYRALIRLVWSPERQFFSGLSLRPVSLGLFEVSPVQPAIVLTSGAVLAGVYLLLQRTDVGIAMRAISSNKRLARTFGLNAEFVIVLVTLLGGAAAGLAGAMLGVFSSVGPTLGFGFLIPVFAAVIVGGIGDPFGAILAGYGIGVAQTVSILVIPSKYAPAVALLFLIVTLLARPEGIFGEATR